jgi:hypothetical protein
MAQPGRRNGKSRAEFGNDFGSLIGVLVVCSTYSISSGYDELFGSRGGNEAVIGGNGEERGGRWRETLCRPWRREELQLLFPANGLESYSLFAPSVIMNIVVCGALFVGAGRCHLPLC